MLPWLVVMMGEVGTRWTLRSDLAQDNEHRQDVWVSIVTRTWELTRQHPDQLPQPVSSNLYFPDLNVSHLEYIKHRLFEFPNLHLLQ